MWIVGVVIIIILLLLLINLHNRKLDLQKQVNYLTPMVETVKNARDILYYCETMPKLKYLYLSPTVNELIGPNTLEEHIQNPDKIFEIVHPDDYETLLKKKLGQVNFSEPITVRLRDNQGKYIWFEEYGTPVYKDGEFVAVQGIMRNIDEKVALHQQLEYKATHDALTGLNNREFFQTKINEYNESYDVPIAVIIGDLDELKFTNDHYGHQMGDRLIQEVGNRLKNYMEKDIVVARIGGDEFAILIAKATIAQAEQFIKSIQLDMHKNSDDIPFFPIKISIGYAYRETSVGVMEKVLNEADANMYKNKNAKKKQLYIEK
jgi:diguanylate cyclase (GGDEF)-like protein/PAS domain S-box-containing protein